MTSVQSDSILRKRLYRITHSAPETPTSVPPKISDLRQLHKWHLAFRGEHLLNLLHTSYVTAYVTLDRGYIYIIKGDMFVCLSVCLFRMAGQTAGPIETKLDTRTHFHPGSVSGKVNVKVIHVCLPE